jgi:hypothetical protein
VLALVALVMLAAPPLDATLRKLEGHAPRGWSVTLADGQLVLAREGKVWALFENRINAPASHETAAARDERIRQHGGQAETRLVWRAEPRWDAERRRKALAANEAVRKELAGLPKKHGVEALRDAFLSRKGETFVGKTDEDRRRIAELEREKARLEALLVRLPDCDTERYSLFQASRSGVEDETTVVSPREASQEAFLLESKLRELCAP